MNNKIKVLIGDDSAGTGVSLANKLREKGIYAYTRRKDCGIIADSVKNDPPDAVVVSVDMNGGDAVELMKKVRGMGVRFPVFIVDDLCFQNLFAIKQLCGFTLTAAGNSGNDTK